MRHIFIPILLTAIFSGSAYGEEAEPIHLAVLEFSTKGGVTPQQMEVLSDMLTTEIRKLGKYSVIGANDIRATFQLEERRRIMGCDDESCVAEVGGALGVQWIVVGNVGLFGQTYLMNLKLLDAAKVKILGAVSRKVTGGQDELLDVLPQMVRELFEGGDWRPAVEKPSPPRPYDLWGHVTLWSGVGLVALGGVSAWQASAAGAEYDKYGKPYDRDASRTWSGVMWTGFGLGAALIATGITLWALEPSADSTTATVIPLPNGAVFSLGGSW
jgi:TolB-like protein